MSLIKIPMPAAPQSPISNKPKQPSYEASAVLDDNTRERWLAWLINMVPNCRWIALSETAPSIAAPRHWCFPEKTDVPDEFGQLVLRARESKNPVQMVIKRGRPSTVLLGFCLKNRNVSQRRVLVIASTSLDTNQKQAAIHLCRWAAHWLDSQLTQDSKRAPLKAPQKRADAALAHNLLSNLSRHGGLEELAFSLVNSIAELCGCSRVTLARAQSGKLKLMAISGQSKIDQKRALAGHLHKAFKETWVKGTLCFQPENMDKDAPAHSALYKANDQHPLLSMRVGGEGKNAFLLMLERPADAPFLAAQKEAINHVLQPVGALLSVVHANEKSVQERLYERASTVKNRWINFGQWSKRRVCFTVACCALLLSALVPVSHKVNAIAHIEAADRQVLVAQQDGFVLSAHARAGEFVESGFVLATLDTSTLNLNAEKWQSEMEKNRQQYSEALAAHNRTELSRLRADAQRIAAEVALIEQKMQKSQLLAPFSGVLMQGDWAQKLGAPVKSGDVLFEIASAEKYRLVLEVDEHDIAFIDSGQPAQLRMASLPNQLWDATLDGLMPVAVSEKGQSRFRLPATISGDATRLRPGMQGIAKVNVGHRSILWVYTHRLFDRIRYVAWKSGLL